MRWRCLVLALIVGLGPGCNAIESQYVHEGIGTTLVSPTIREETSLQDDYVSLICRQSTGEDVCRDWNSFVVAGMNDIDQRCDAYLAWLDDRRRNVAPVLQEMSDAGTTTGALLLATGAGPAAMGIATAAFGFARDSFNNFNSRLLFEIDKSTVQAIALREQNRLREEVRGRRIETRPDAIYALRQYLRVCMPFTIETEINKTLSTFVAGGPEALAQSEPLVAATTIGPVAVPIGRVAATPRTRVAPRQFASAAGAVDSQLLPFLAEPPARFSQKPLKHALDAICVTGDEIKNGQSALTVARVKAFQQYWIKFGKDTLSAPTGKLTTAEVAGLATEAACPSSAQNYAEAQLPNLANPKFVTTLKTAFPTETAGLPDSPNAEDVRNILPSIRKNTAVEPLLTLRDPMLERQLTLDLASAISHVGRHPEKPAQ